MFSGLSLRSIFVLFLLTLVVLSACEHGKPALTSVVAQDPAWRNIVSAHTTGVVSRGSQIRVLFAGDVVPAEVIGKSAKGRLEIVPAAAGEAQFAGAREIVFTPAKNLKPGETYRVRLIPIGLTGVPETFPPYEFDVRVQPPEFEVTVNGLSPDVSGSSMQLTGSLATADAEDSARVEKILTVSDGSRALEVEWNHDAARTRHEFKVVGISRLKATRAIDIAWNGEAIGASTVGKERVDVPAYDEFSVTQVDALDDAGQRYVTVNFSDALDARQDLRGLVQLSAGNFTMRVEGSTLKLYPESAPDGDVLVTLQSGVRSAVGERLDKAARHTVKFESTKPQVRFTGRGVILPPGKTLAVPFEAVNVRAVHVTALEIREKNIGQFLQVNSLDGSRELGRVGQYLWRKTVPLTAATPGRWNRYSLDVTELFQKYPNALVRLSLTVTRADSTYACADAQTDVGPGSESSPADPVDGNAAEASNWDGWQQELGANDGSGWRERNDPCKDAYFQYTAGAKSARNFLASNIGLVAKRDQHGEFLIVTTDLLKASPLAGVTLTMQNYQGATVGAAVTDAVGIAHIKPSAVPYTLLAQKDAERGYLKVNAGNALPVSHFDVGGEIVTAGLKGTLFGERGVWRPGDTMHLTFVMQDIDKRLPANHPVTLELYNPRGQRVQSVTNASPVGSFYAFTLNTPEDAPTGDWTAKALLGGATFTKSLRVETVMPNRLKVDLQTDPALKAGQPLQAKLFGQWLTGASAEGLKADVTVRFSPQQTRFDRYADFIFDDPTRELSSRPETIFEGVLDKTGIAQIEKSVAPTAPAPGMLNAAFTSRVFERGGAFSINHSSTSFAPYDYFIGMRLPKGDVARGMLQTDTPHTVELAGLTAEGQPTSIDSVQVTLYKVEWKWWWDQSGESLAQYTQASSSSVVQQDTVAITQGRGAWVFNIQYPQWGRYLVRACDVKGGHCTGKTFYIDWPSWAGRPQDQSGPAASALTLTADKEQYVVGDTASIQLPAVTEGRALITIENGSGIQQMKWLVLSPKVTRFEVPVTAAMSPNVYVSVTLVQPHESKDNDRPIRLYGVIPLKVSDPAKRLKPVVRTASEWKPQQTADVEVAESTGHSMTYTLAVVDEGLLDLTSFKTPDLYQHFYKREALGITTWDLFDEVGGAYGAQLERLLALGGSDGQALKNSQERETRFPPVVRFLGPFQLAGGITGKHSVTLPQYVGAVRVMVVAGEAGAYGSAEKSVRVRQPLMVLPTVPRVIGAGEEATIPVSLFVMDDSIRSVTLQAEGDAHFELVGDRIQTVSFTRAEEKLGLLRIKAANRTGKGRIRFTATSGEHHAQADVFLEVRSSNPATTRVVRKTLKPTEQWQTKVTPHGLPGTNAVTLEVSSVPPLGLEQRLDYLIHYPYGCLEQTTSSVFPQLYLPALVKMEDARRKEVEKNIRAGIDRLRGFQQPNGGFAYWPGGFVSTQPDDQRNAWSTTYVGHFLIEADRLGYSVPSDMMKSWLRYQRSAAQSWTSGTHASALDQAYRLYTLALANRAEVGAMNRLRESGPLLPVERWMLGAAYHLAGMQQVAQGLVLEEGSHSALSQRPAAIFGSPLRDSAMILDAAVSLGRLDGSKPLVDEISAALASDEWHSTQEVAFSLMAVSKLVGANKAEPFQFVRRIGDQDEVIDSSSPIYSAALSGFPERGNAIALENKSTRTLFATIVTRGVPAAGQDDAAAEGLALSVSYTDSEGRTVDPAQVAQGTDLLALVAATNSSGRRIENIALTEMLPAGWEILNDRLAGAPAAGSPTAGVPSASMPAAGLPAAGSEYTDIRDDRIYRFFALKSGASASFTTRLNAAYLGRFYLPSVSVEAMYDASKFARTQGRWIEVVTPGGAP